MSKMGMPMRLPLIMMSFAVLTTTARAQELPVGKSKALVQTACTQCHGTDVIAAQRHTRDEWTEVVSRMVGNGAQLSDSDFSAVVEYLTTYLSPNAKNTAASRGSAHTLPPRQPR